LIIKCSLGNQKAKFRLHLHSYNLNDFRKNSGNPWSSILWHLHIMHTEDRHWQHSVLCAVCWHVPTLKHCAFFWYSYQKQLS